MSAGVRRRGREAALQLLYLFDVGGDDSSAARELFWSSHPGGDAEVEVREFAEALVETTRQRCESLDSLIDAAATNWDINRFSRVDLAIMRLACAELVASPEVPGEVIVNEAVDIARRFSDDRAARFINGVLDRIAGEQGRLTRAARK
ncbi:MAG: N utilization substance protein B [Candidatus Binatia bacterium]|jgi:N utilization substance protein B